MFAPARAIFFFAEAEKTLENCGIGRGRRRLEFMQPSSSFPKGKKLLESIMVAIQPNSHQMREEAAASCSSVILEDV